MKKKIKVMVADDHEIVRTGFGALIDLEDDMRCVSMVKNGALAVEQAAATEPDVIVMDLAMPVLDGIAATRQIVAATPGVRVLILTSLGTPEELQKAMDAGASGILLKSSSNRDLIMAIRRLHAGETVLGTHVQAMLNDRPPMIRLSPRQKEALQFVVRGFTNKDIAQVLGISYSGVKRLIEASFAKLGVATRAEATAMIKDNRLLNDSVISPPPEPSASRS